VTAKIETHEFLRFATNAGWLSTWYSYTFRGGFFSGEFRKYIVAKKTSKAESDPETIALLRRFSVGSQIQIRIDPDRPAKSIVEFHESSGGVVRTDG